MPRIWRPCCNEQGEWNATRGFAVLAGERDEVGEESEERRTSSSLSISAKMTSLMSFDSSEILAAFSAYCASCISRCPYSLTMVPQPLAVMTTASASASMGGHQASMLGGM